MGRNGRFCYLLLAELPAATYVGMPWAGLRTHEQGWFPKRRLPMLFAQWRLADYLLIYRCGGSAGIAGWRF